MVVMYREDTVGGAQRMQVCAGFGLMEKKCTVKVTEVDMDRSIYLKVSGPFAYSREHRVPPCQCLYYCFSAYTKAYCPTILLHLGPNPTGACHARRMVTVPIGSQLTRVCILQVSIFPGIFSHQCLSVTHTGLKKLLRLHKPKKLSCPQVPASAMAASSIVTLEAAYTGEMALGSLF